MVKDNKVKNKNLHIEISKELDNRLREATHKAKTVYDKDLSRRKLVTTALETYLKEVENDKEAFKKLIGAGNSA